jgi:DNA adenine methylase
MYLGFSIVAELICWNANATKRRNKMGNAFRYCGAKGRFIQHILPLFPPHSQWFLDVFCGSGSVILGKKPHTHEVANDKLGHITNFFSVLKDRKECRALCQRLLYTPPARDTFNQALAVLADPRRSAVDQAWAWCYKSNLAYAGGKATSFSGKKFRRIESAIRHIESVAWRFRNVLIENMDYRELLQRYGNENAFAYEDPPYPPDVRHRDIYDIEMTLADHEELLRVNLTLRFPVMISGYPHPLYSKYLRGWRTKKFDWFATTGNKTGRKHAKRTEVVWMNYLPNGELIR